ncbi:MAG: cytochrome c biogenesis protein CcsA [Oligoflexia bacterium]|nr:cytochrome c biogenesis protein CcsA [Oligoflexia bacterium]
MHKLIWGFLAVTFMIPIWAFANQPDPFMRTWSKTDWVSEIKALPIQSAGRLKPFDTFSREAFDLFVGKEKFRGKESYELVLSILFEPQVWQEIQFIQISHQELRKDLALDQTRQLYSPKELMHAPRMMPLFQELDAKQRAEEKLDPYFQAVLRLANQMAFLQQLVSGGAIRVIPPNPSQAMESDTWLSFSQFTDEQKLRFALLPAGFTSDKQETREKLAEYITKFKDLARQNNPNLYPSDFDMKLEVHFNALRPFRVAWILALVASIFIGFSIYGRPSFYKFGMAFFLVSFFIQTYGFFLRCWIAGRPPVSNMYESIIFVAFGSMLFGLIFELIYKKKLIALASLIFAVISLIISDNVGSVMDDGIHPLESVLRSNMWLTVHVLTITLGYAAFALSLVYGNMGLIPYLFTGKESKHMGFRDLAFFSYRAVQVGVILLAAGTILGGVWADYSWGRFWGWDPKETWALIALLGYLALIHARFRGLVGHFGFLAGCVVAFMGVLMAWYGVNFVLGQGKHSYGFSTGGVSYVATYCSLQLLVIAWAIYQKKKSAKS